MMRARYIHYFLFCFLGALGIKESGAACVGQNSYQYFQMSPSPVVSVDPAASIGSILATGSLFFVFTCVNQFGALDTTDSFTFASGDTGQQLGGSSIPTTVPGVSIQHTFTDIYINGQYRPELSRSIFGINSFRATNVQTVRASININLIKTGNITGGALTMFPAAQAWFTAIGGFQNQGRIAPFINQLQFNVEQPKAICSLTTPSLTVPLEPVSINTLNQTPDYQVVDAGRFNIGISCTANARVELAFTDAYNSNNSLLQMNSTMNNQPINGVGLSIIPANNPYKRSNIIRDSLPIDFIGNLNQNIPFAVYYQRQPYNGPVLVPGEFRSMANFTLAYQ